MKWEIGEGENSRHKVNIYTVSNFHVLKFILDHDILNIDIGWFVDWFPNCLSNILWRQHFVRMIPEGQRVTLNLKVSHNLPIIKKNLSTCWPDGVNVAVTIFLHHSCAVLISKHLSEPLSVHKPREDVDHLHPCSFDLLSEKWKVKVSLCCCWFEEYAELFSVQCTASKLRLCSRAVSSRARAISVQA